MRQKVLFTAIMLSVLTVPVAGIDDKERKLLPIPTSAAQTKAEFDIKVTFKDQYAAAKTSSKKRALADLLLKYAAETKDDPTTRFVLLREARDQAAEAGAFATVQRAVEEMCRWYEVSPLAMKAEALTKADKAKLPASQAESLAEQALSLVDAAIADDQYDLADRMGAIAQTAAATASNRYLQQQAKERIGQIERSRKAYATVKTAIEFLKDHPDDPAANLTVGKHLCFVNNAWAKGLPFLAKGGDKNLAQVAAKDAAKPTSANEQLKIADDWYDLAAGETGPVKYKLLKRAHDWYLEAVAGLSGLPKVKIAKRIEEVEDAMESSPGPKAKLELHIVADIDGTDWLRISALEAVWTHGAYQWPSSVKINNLTWIPAEKPQNPKAGIFALLGRRVDFSTAKLTKIKGRGTVKLKKAKDQAEIYFEDNPFGSDIYEVVVTFSKAKTK